MLSQNFFWKLRVGKFYFGFSKFGFGRIQNDLGSGPGFTYFCSGFRAKSLGHWWMPLDGICQKNFKAVFNGLKIWLVRLTGPVCGVVR